MPVRPTRHLSLAVGLRLRFPAAPDFERWRWRLLAGRAVGFGLLGHAGPGSDLKAPALPEAPREKGPEPARGFGSLTPESNAAHNGSVPSGSWAGWRAPTLRARPLLINEGRRSVRPLWQAHTWLANAGSSGTFLEPKKLATVPDDCVPKRTDKKTSPCFAETCAWRGG
jgi:hypothetical protein